MQIWPSLQITSPLMVFSSIKYNDIAIGDRCCCSYSRVGSRKKNIQARNFTSFFSDWKRTHGFSLFNISGCQKLEVKLEVRRRQLYEIFIHTLKMNVRVISTRHAWTKADYQTKKPCCINKKLLAEKLYIKHISKVRLSSMHEKKNSR